MSAQNSRDQDASPWGDAAVRDVSLTRTAEGRATTPLPRRPSVPKRFHLLEELGQGGMGVVHRAFDCDRQQTIALKSISGLRADELYRLKREFRLLADLRHPNLVRLHDLYADNANPFFTMELVAGVDLRQFMRGSRPNGALGCDFVRLRDMGFQLASALAAAHSAGTLHCDVKPSNILVTDSGRLVLFDFGLGASFSAGREETERSGMLAGTRGYLSPEQARGEALSAATDWYSFGVTLFEAATGRLPFAEHYKPLLSHRRPGEQGRLSAHLPDAPRDLDELIAGLLQVAPEKRPTGAEVLRVMGAAAPSQQRPVAVTRSPVDSHPTTAALLQNAVHRARTGRSTIVHLHGDAGSVQSDLARSLVATLEQQGICVLRGRCRPMERVAYNAVDEVIDDLSRVLQHTQSRELPEALAPQLADASKLFPVLKRLERDPIERQGTREASSRETDAAYADNDVRHRACRALCEILAGATYDRPLLIWIDDIHFSDSNSPKLLREFLQQPDMPPLVLLLSYCDHPSRRSVEAFKKLSASVFPVEVNHKVNPFGLHHPAPSSPIRIDC